MEEKNKIIEFNERNKFGEIRKREERYNFKRQQILK